MRIAVLRGGPSRHYETSMNTGSLVLSLLREEPEKYKPIDIFISRDGEWHISGRRQEPHKALRHADLVWNALHGDFGEDGRLSSLLSSLNIPHTGSSTLGLAVSINKDLSKKAYELHGMPTPRHEILLGHVSLDNLLTIFRTYMHPVMVKPVRGRGSLGVMKAHSFEELKEAVVEAFRHAERVMVEEFVRGVVASCGVIEGLRGERHYALIPTPNEWRPDVHKRVEQMARRAHEALGLRHYSSSDFIITPKGKIYILETNALPDLADDSPMARSLESVGLSRKDFVEHVISIAI